MADMSAADDVFGRLSMSLAPLVVHPLQRYRQKSVSLKGFARVGDQAVRVMLTTDVVSRTGFAVEFDLIYDDEPLSTPDAIAFLRELAGRLTSDFDGVATGDGQDNKVVRARGLGFANGNSYREVDLNVYSLITVLESGGTAPWFEELFKFRGFAYSGRDGMRVYLRSIKRSEIIGIDIPTRTFLGNPRGFTALPHELVALFSDEQTFSILPRGATDDYCETAVDMSEWLGAG